MKVTLERVNIMRDALDQFLNTTGNLVNATNHQPAPESIAARELQEFERKISIKTAQDISYLLLESTADYVSCLVKGLTDPVETIATWSLARGVMECSANSIWLGRPDISPIERVNRSLAFRLKGIQEQARLRKHAPEIVVPLKSSTDMLIATAKELGVEIKTKPDGVPTKIGTHLPSATELCESELGESNIYRILSAITHSQPFAIQQLSFRPVGKSKTDPDRVDNEKYMTNESAAFMCSFAGRSFLRALSARLKYFGYLKGEVVTTIRSTADDLLLTDEEFQYCIWSR